MTRTSKLAFALASLALCHCGDKSGTASTATSKTDGTATKSTSQPAGSSSTSSSAATASTGKPAARALPWEGAKPCEMGGLSGGVTNYLAESKTAEAKNTLGAISRAAMASYEREQMATEILTEGSAEPALTHALCKSSTVVPLEVPSGRKYQPDDASEKDFNTGDATTGWKCLRFNVTDPVYYQYKFAQGSGYVGPARGLPDPGPDGFEASATGDLDGNGKTSVFTIVGVVDKKDNSVKVSTSLYCSNPEE